jgi:hypothetical protein
MSLKNEFDKLFGAEKGASIPSSFIKQLLRHAWMGDMSEEGLRPMCWRIMLGLLSSNNKFEWVPQLNNMISSYSVLKRRVMPSLDKVKVDPLSALSDGDNISDEWLVFYKNVELISFIKGDLDRLYLNGLDENFFQTKPMRSLLLSILFIWASEHSHISYRQGMHEICGIVVACIYVEYHAWNDASRENQAVADYPLLQCFTEQNIEAYSYILFERIMMELEVLYDPLPVSGAENMPFIVQFCTKIQGKYMAMLHACQAVHHRVYQ